MISEEIKEILIEQPELSFDESSGQFIGKLFISELDSYEIVVDLEPFPKHFPNVYEIGDRIPRKPSRHKYDDSDQCCLTTMAKAQVLIKTKVDSITKFFDLILVPYFQNNSFYEINREYVQGEYSHDGLGILEGYQDILGIENPFVITKVIQDRINGVKMTIRDGCFCGNGKTMKKCNTHLMNYRKFRHIDKETLILDLIRIDNLINEYLMRVNSRKGIWG